MRSVSGKTQRQPYSCVADVLYSYPIMRQPHRNLFFFYRGSHARDSQRDSTYEKQLEDNTTKALIHVLEHSDRERVLKVFLRDICHIRNRYHFSATQFALQRVDIQRPAIPQRIALAIAPESGLVSTKGTDHQAGRPDAWIWSENEFAVLLENKITGRANRHQIRRHIAGARGWRSGKNQIISSSWSEVYALFEHLRHHEHRLDRISRFLIDEFVEYLKMIGVAKSLTFDIDDFAFFTIRTDDRQAVQKEIVARKLGDFTEALTRSAAVRKIAGLYGKKYLKSGPHVNPGVFRANSSAYWITLGPKERRNHCHITVRISEEGITLDAFTPHKAFTSRLIKAIRDEPERFLDTLRRIPDKDPFLIRLREAYYAHPSSPYKGQQARRLRDIIEVHPSFLNEKNVESLIVDPVSKRLRRKNLRPELFLVRKFHPSELLSNPDAVHRVAEAAEKMVPYLQFALGVTHL